MICGPTAVGKTQLSIDLAKRFNGEIISTDSRQFFREMSIGTAKPSIEEMDGIVHHFIDSHSIEEEYTAGKFETDAIERIEEIHARKKLPILVGGSGLYIKAVLEGLDEMPADSTLREALNQVFDSQGIAPLQERLRNLDADYFNSIDQKNHIRVIRAIEIIETSGHKMAELQSGREKNRPFEPIIIGLDCERSALYERINLRVDLMVEAGLVEEVKSLLPYMQKQALQTVGYREFIGYFEGSMNLTQAVELVKRNSRRYAKRQLTWLRSMPGIVWFSRDGQGKISDHIKSNLIEIQ